MNIEIHINGQLRKCWQVPEASMAPIEGASWTDNVKARQLIADRLVHQFLAFVVPLFDDGPHVQYFITFESKLHLEPETE